MKPSTNEILNASCSELRDQYADDKKLAAFRLKAELFDPEDVPVEDFIAFYHEIAYKLAEGRGNDPLRV